MQESATWPKVFLVGIFFCEIKVFPIQTQFSDKQIFEDLETYFFWDNVPENGVCSGIIFLGESQKIRIFLRTYFEVERIRREKFEVERRQRNAFLALRIFNILEHEDVLCYSKPTVWKPYFFVFPSVSFDLRKRIIFHHTRFWIGKKWQWVGSYTLGTSQGQIQRCRVSQTSTT